MALSEERYSITEQSLMLVNDFKCNLSVLFVGVVHVVRDKLWDSYAK